MLSIKFPRFRIAVSYTEKHPDGFYWPEEEKSFLWFKYWSALSMYSDIGMRTRERALIEFVDRGKTNFIGTKEFAIAMIKIRKQIVKEAAERAAKLAHRKKLGANRTQYIDY